MSKYYIKCGTFFDGVAMEWQKNIGITVENDRITAVGKNVVPPADAQVIDLSDKTVTPGLIDAHVHLDFMGPYSFNTYCHTTSDEMKAINILYNSTQALQGGFTTLRLIGANLNGFGAIDAKRAIDEGLFPASRLVVSPHFLGIPGGHGDVSANISGNYYLSEAMEDQTDFTGSGVDFYKRAVRKEVKYGADFIKIMASGGFASPNDDPCDCQLDDDELKAIIDTAKQLHKKVTAHVYSAEISKNLLRMGIDGIEHGSLIDEETFDLLKEKGAYLVCTFQPYQEAVHMDEAKLATKSIPFQRKLRKYLTQLQETRKLTVQKILEDELLIGYGTDMVSVYNNFECWHEFHTWRLEGIPALRTLKAATSVNAKILELEDVGELAVGKIADISAWAGDVENDPMAISHCEFVMKEGRIYKNV